MKRLVLLLGFAACGGSSTTPTAMACFRRKALPVARFTSRSAATRPTGRPARPSASARRDRRERDRREPDRLFCDVRCHRRGARPGRRHGDQQWDVHAQASVPDPVAGHDDVPRRRLAGRLPNFTINDLDFDNQFDTTTDPDTGDFTNITITGPRRHDFTPMTVTAFQITGQVSIDGDATPAPSPFRVGSRTPVMSVAGNMAVVTRAPTPLTSGTASSGMIADIGDTGFFRSRRVPPRRRWFISRSPRRIRMPSPARSFCHRAVTGPSRSVARLPSCRPPRRSISSWPMSVVSAAIASWSRRSPRR